MNYVVIPASVAPHELEQVIATRHIVRLLCYSPTNIELYTTNDDRIPLRGTETEIRTVRLSILNSL